MSYCLTTSLSWDWDMWTEGTYKWGKVKNTPHLQRAKNLEKWKEAQQKNAIHPSRKAFQKNNNNSTIHWIHLLATWDSP